jgi:rhodanese-related sulfurtransferase
MHNWVFRQAVQEAALIILVAAGIGFVYTASTHRGLFTEKQGPTAAVDTSIFPQFVLYDEAVQLYQSGEATFIDARHSFDFGLGHITSAINIPLKDFTPANLGGIPQDRILVVYCDGQECNSSVELAKRIASHGFRNVKIFFGGWREWSDHKQPTQP